jgi:hypothetical protein
MREIFATMIAAGVVTPAETFDLEVESADPRVAFEILKRQPWAHVRVEKVPS